MRAKKSRKLSDVFGFFQNIIKKSDAVTGLNKAIKGLLGPKMGI